MAKLTAKRKENPKLCEKTLLDGRKSLYLEYYFGYKKVYCETEQKFKIKHKRQKESLELYLHANPNTPKKKTEDKDALEKALKVRQQREEEIKSKKLGFVDKYKNKSNFLDYCDRFLADYPFKDIRIVRYCITYLKKFVRKEKKTDFILPADITTNFALRFKNYLEEHLNGETPYNYFTKFKHICKRAVHENYPIDNLVLEIRNTRNESLKKEILNFKEIQTLANAECGNPEVKRAFLFCLNTGLRFCDTTCLKWKDIYEDKILIKSQRKTGKFVSININDNTRNFLGVRGKRNDTVFELPSLSSSLRTLKKWCERAGIDRNIKWHSSRHSFAVNLLIKKADIKTVSGLLGHTGIRHTEKYTRLINEQSEIAVNSLPDIIL